jgi:DNA-binding transcriptional regulator YiaG
MDFPSALTEAIRSRNMTDEQVAMTINVTTNSIQKWRAGHTKPRGPMRSALVRMFPELQEAVRALAEVA